MPEYIEFKKSNCKNCYKCIRHCPVKSIRFSCNQAYIAEDECILCGHCFMVCPQNAKVIRNDVEKVKAVIKDRKPVYASIAPSFAANYIGTSIRSMEKALKKLGFWGASETAIGATMVKKCYEKLIYAGDQSIIISSCCPSVNLLIQKHYPEALPFLANVVSPMQAHCESIKAAHPDAKTVFIGPCISKKSEAEQYPGAVDFVLTFEELSGWLNEEKIIFEPIPDATENSRARLFPIAGGILRTMGCNRADYAYVSVDGMENCIRIIKDIINGGLKKCFIEMSACEGSCIGGPALDKNHRTPLRNYLAVDKYAGEKDFEIEMLPDERLKKYIRYIGLNRQMPGSGAIEEILKQMGKTKPEHELNCGSCGYDSCREKAAAVLLGKADLTMCLPFLKEKAESFSENIINNTPNGIIVLNESMEIQQINSAALHILSIKESDGVLGEQAVRIIDPSVFIEVLQSGRNVYEKRLYLAEYEKYVVQTVVYDKSYHIIISIMRDVTNEEKARAKKEMISQRTIEITDKVIGKQMRVVQEIASLLGETTAETKIALTKLKESLGDE